MRIFFALLLSAISITISAQRPEKGEGGRPNIIYILADDLGYGDVQALNAASGIPTPHMDQLVRQGIHFTDAHSNSAVCTPTRYGILTGRYAFRTSLKQGVLWGYAPPLIAPEQETVATFLKRSGYQTACIGKWHLGLNWSRKDAAREILQIVSQTVVTEQTDDNVDYTKPVTDGPLQHGFDYSLIIPASLDMSPYCYIRNGVVTTTSMVFTEGKNPKQDGRGLFWRPGKMAKDFDFYKVLPNLVDSACHYIKEHSRKSDPFFLYMALPAPHTPWLPSEEYGARSKAGRYGDFVTMTDAMIGRIVKLVEQLRIEEQTLIIVASDNGADWRPSDIEETGHQANYHFKGRKADIYEAGHRIPFFASWKGVIPPGIQSGALLSTTDLMATLAGLLNTPLPKNAGEDSYNLWPLFRGEKRSSPIRETMIHHSEKGFFAIRKGHWKYTPQLGSGGFSIPMKGMPENNEPPGTLYNIVADPGEAVNLYENYPSVVQTLDRLLKALVQNGNSRGQAEPEIKK